ncbi:MAG: hypothetical protein LBR50_04645 [Tannerella sp.]|jgi:tetratricopeptide (TPR) repeat protein|nr:hypothetical protein [Tannerella sp.]
MTIKEINNLHAQTVGMLDNGMLKSAFELIKTLISETRSYIFQNRLDELQETYRYMLDYFAKGIYDDMRSRIYANIVAGTYELADKIRQIARISDSRSIHYTSVMALVGTSDEIADMLNKTEQLYEIGNFAGLEEINNQIFISLWTTAFLNDTDATAVSRALTNEATPVVTKCQMISSLMLGLQMCFDLRKMTALFDAAASDNDEVRMRAIIAICLTLNTYKNRTKYYPDIRYRLETLAETPDFKRIITMIELRFILSRETEKVSSKLQEELIPEILKLVKKRKADRKTGNSDSDAPDIFGDDMMNPEWEEITENSPLAKKIEEYNDLQEEGIDVMHSTFLNLKNFPFFRSVSNWFLPFTSNNAILAEQTEIKPALIRLLDAAPFICNSDKFSMVFSLAMLPKDQKTAIMKQVESQFKMANEHFAEELQTKTDRTETVVSQYVQDLFRFYKLFPHKDEFDDIFGNPPVLYNIPDLQAYLSEPNILLQFAELYLRKNYFTDAQVIYEQLIKALPADEMLYQKLGYCKQMSGDIAGALDDYLRSEIINANSKWLIRRIGNCYKQLKQPDRALEYFLRLETMLPDNASVLLLIGHCHLDLQNYPEALKCYFKADYIYPNNVKAWRAIAWCSFMNGKYEQARNYNAKILEAGAQTSDYLNAGHTEWALKNIDAAVDFYSKAAAMEEEFEKFAKMFARDISVLADAGINRDEIMLMIDYLHFLR